jgi:nitrite reductase/ring-hydroxylating ferredoxin subunit
MRVELSAIAEIPEGALKEIEFFGRSVILTRTAQSYAAFANVCPHASGPLTLEDGSFKCQWHGATFKALNGQQLEGPRGNTSGLIRLPTRVEGDTLVYLYGE